MQEKNKILNRIKPGQGLGKPGPYLPSGQTGQEGLAAQFMKNLSASGGRAYEVGQDDLKRMFREVFSDQGHILNFSDHLNIPSDSVNEGESGLLIVDGLIGVAGNGAVWLTEKEVGERKNPFIAAEILVLLPSDRIVQDFFRAYRKIDLNSGFGIWIAGPSKTADIEQSLVFGAQGTLRHTVFILS